MASSKSCWLEYFKKLKGSFIYVVLCVVLFHIGFIKGIIMGITTTIVIFAGLISVTIILWPIHVFKTYNAIARTKKLGFVIKLPTFILLLVPLFLWPMLVAIGSILIGLGYGFGTPLFATFEDATESMYSKIYQAFASGTTSTLFGAYNIVLDFTNLCINSYFHYLNDLKTVEPEDNKPFDIKLFELSACFIVGVLGLLVDIPLISFVALIKSPILLFKGWRKLVLDSMGRHGPCLEAECVPFGGLAFILWPAITVMAVIFAILSSPILGLYGVVVVYQEDSLRNGLAYIVSIVSIFDEYTNDMLYLNEGSCLPRPDYRKVESMPSSSSMSLLSPKNAISNSKIVHQLTTSSSMKQQLQEINAIQLWKDMFRSLNLRGKYLLDVGVLKASDLNGWLDNANDHKWKIIGSGLPAYCILHTLLESIKFNSIGLLLSDGTELTMYNRPEDRLLDWFFEPLLTIKEQLQHPIPTIEEVYYLEKLILIRGDSTQILEWRDGNAEPSDEIRRGFLQAMSRRLLGIATSISRLPTYCRNYKQIIKNLLMYILNRSNFDGFSSISEESIRFDQTLERNITETNRESSSCVEEVVDNFQDCIDLQVEQRANWMHEGTSPIVTETSYKASIDKCHCCEEPHIAKMNFL